MSEFDGYTRVEDGLPGKNMFVDAVLVRPDGIFKQMKIFYRAKVKKEYFTDKNGIRRKRVSDVGFVIQKPHEGCKVIAWKEHKELSSILDAIYGKG